MQRFLNLAAVSVFALAAAGCTTAPSGPLTAANNTGLYSLHQPVVERTDFVFDVATSGDSVPAAERERLSAWFDSIDLGYGDRLTVDEPAGYESAGAREDVGRVAARYGMALSTDAAPVTDGEVPAGTLRVVASRSTARVEGCPTWGNTGIASTTTTSTNYGCAVNSNIAAMVADPNDLVLGQNGSGRGSASTATRAIRVYRERVPSGTQALPTATTRGQ